MKYLTFLVLLLIAIVSKAQIGINSTGSAPNNSAMLDVQSTTKGTLITRMNSSQRKAIVNPAVGLLVFDVDANTIFLFDGQNWLPVLMGGSSNDVPLIQRYAPDGLANDNFGHSVAISGDYAVVGSPFNDIDGKNNQGAAYIFKRDNGTWTVQQKITSANGFADDLFGYSVAIDGDNIIVGGIHANVWGTQQGAAYIFHRSGTTWTMQEQLIPIRVQMNDNVGCSVSIAGDYAIVGSYNADGGTGAVNIYRKEMSGWNPIQRIVPTDGIANDNFGNSIAISGDYIVVGSYLSDNGTFINQGSVYIYQKDANNLWAFQQKVVPSNGQSNDKFGSSVAITSDYVVVGSPYSDNGSVLNQGSTYVYKRNGNIWGQEFQILTPNGQANDYNGVSVSIEGDYILVSAYNDDRLRNFQGLAYIYKRNGTSWNMLRKIFEPTPSTSNSFGFSVGLNGGRFVVGAIGNSNVNLHQGAVSFGKIDY
jgi:FG-GAP repeat